MDTSLAIIVIGILLILLYIRAKTEKEISETKSTSPVENDTLILIYGDYEIIKKVVLDFRKVYNDKSIKIHLRLIEYTSQSTFILFPFAIEFEQLCFLHNYLIYPKNISVSLDVSTWYTAVVKTNWVHEKMYAKKILLYIPEGNNSYDHVYAITENNDDFKIDFAGGVSEIEPLGKSYIGSPTDLEVIKNMPYEDL